MDPFEELTHRSGSQNGRSPAAMAPPVQQRLQGTGAVSQPLVSGSTRLGNPFMNQPSAPAKGLTQPFGSAFGVRLYVCSRITASVY